jgi:hypothetical protein
MVDKSAIFKKTYQAYLKQIAQLGVDRIKSKAEQLGGRMDRDVLIVPFFARPHRISAVGIFDPSGAQPLHAVSVVLSKYVLLCPEYEPHAHEWVSYRDFRDAALFAGAFATNAEESLAEHFTGRVGLLEKAAAALGGRSIDASGFSYDLVRRFDALPKVSILMLFNDADEEFRAQTVLLFEKCAERYLDMECLAIIGMLLSDYLHKAADGGDSSLV